LAQAIVTAARRATVPIENATDVEFQRGRGVTGRWKSHEVVIGNVQLMTDRDMDISAATSHLDPNRAGMGLVYVAIDGAVVGSVLLADQPRGDAEHCIRELRNRGATVTMLTGDRQTVASDVARQLGIDDVRSGLLPQDKLTELSALQEHGPVGVVGDGLNDAPALVQADVGFAMGRRASDLALDSADVVVLSPQLSRIPQAVLLAKATRRALWQNIGLAIGIKAIVLLVTAAGYGSMWLAVAADVGASLIVVANGMTLLRYDPPACCEEHARADPHEHGAGCHHPLDGHVESPTDDTCEQPI
jgi:Cd2+/Zn2+-exporting ATPase